eukprot:TRINITY_DN4129_c0_g1_i4.p1 TRINITY_DN4129_c0_g1~~TRINITY_DN4129_c0_g1_i4.p1  ORF type:complete len:241 (-),score=26.49 TRINITY_DN4129_c0_g1_i4:153-875(-)
MLLKDSRIEFDKDNHNTALDYAAERGELDIMKKILSNPRVRPSYCSNDLVITSLKKYRLMTAILLSNDSRIRSSKNQYTQYTSQHIKILYSIFFVLYFLFTFPLVVSEGIILDRTFGTPCNRPLQTFIIVCCITKGISLIIGILGFIFLFCLPSSLSAKFVCYGPLKLNNYIRIMFFLFHIVWTAIGASWLSQSFSCNSELVKLTTSVVTINFVSALFSCVQCAICSWIYQEESSYQNGL